MKNFRWLAIFVLCCFLFNYCTKSQQRNVEFKWPEAFREPPLANANPAVRHDTTITILTKICNRKIDDTVVFFFDSSSFDEIDVSIGENMFIGMIIKTYRPSLLNINNDPKLFKNVERNRWAASTIFGKAKALDSMFLGSEVCRVPTSVINDTDIRIELEIFETDILPSGRLWNPRSKKFKLFWADTLYAKDYFTLSDSTTERN